MKYRKNTGTLIVAGNNLTLNTATNTQNLSLVANQDNWTKSAGTQDIGTNIQTTGDLNLLAGNNLTATAASVDSERGALTAIAGNNLKLLSGTQTSTNESASKSSQGGFLSNSTTTTYDKTTSEEAIGSVFSGNTTTLQAGKDLTLKGSSVVSTEDTTLIAGNNINLQSATNTYNQIHQVKETQNGLLGGGGGMGFGIGTQETNTKNTNKTTTQVGSVVGSLTGDVNIQAGNAYTQIASDVIALTGDINIIAKDIEIKNGLNTSTTKDEYSMTQTGLSFGVTNPLISGVQTGQQMVNASQQTDNLKLQALAAGTAALAGYNAYDQVSRDPMALGGVNVSANIGTSKTESTTTTNTITAASSNLAAQNINLIATGEDGKNNTGDIRIQGSNLNATNDINLIARNNLEFMAVQNTSQTDSTYQSTSASVGLGLNLGSSDKNPTGFGNNGLTVNGSYSQTNSNSNQNTTDWTNTRINAGDSLNLVSGKDTTIQGAVLSGNQVIANVAGNLLIESLKDTDNYHSNSNTIGGTASYAIVGTGTGFSANYGETNMNSNYASVTEQSGIRAGDGGFQLHVDGNTSLIGAVISSTEKAIQDNKNLLETGTLSIKDITNYAHYDASSIQLGMGYGGSVGIDQKGEATAGSGQTPGTTLANLDGISATLPAAMTAEDSASSTTKSGISAGTIIITDKDKHQQVTGESAETTIANLNRDVETGKDTTNALNQIFDKDEIQAGFDIVQGLTREVGTFLENRARESTKAEEELEAELKKPKDQQDQNKIAQLTETLKDNETWGMGGTGRQILTAVTLAASGNVTGTGAQFIQSAAINYFQSLAVQEVKLIADGLGENSEAARTALQGIVGCAGAVAQSADCGSAAMGAAASVVLNNLVDSITKEAGASLSAEEKNARENLIATVITGITAAAGGDAAIANASAQMETENNILFVPVILAAAWAIDKGITAYDVYQDLKAIQNGEKTLDELAKEKGEEYIIMALVGNIGKYGYKAVKAGGKWVAESVEDAGKVVKAEASITKNVSGRQIRNVTPSLDKLDSLRGANPETIEELIPDNWIKMPIKKGEGMRYFNPEKKGEVIMIEKGWPNSKDPLHQGPYLRISRDGQITRIPLKGNPVLK